MFDTSVYDKFLIVAKDGDVSTSIIWEREREKEKSRERKPYGRCVDFF